MTREQWRLIGGFATVVSLYAFFMSGKCPQQAPLKSAPPDSEFDPDDLALGASVEAEHTRSRRTAKQIAKHHLMEDPRYYQKLSKVHLD